MFRIRCQFLVFLALATAPLHLYAHQPKRGKVIATWGPVFFQRQVEYKYDHADNPLGAGFFIVAEGDVDSNGGLEITLGYEKKRYFRREGESILVEDAKRIHTSTGYRHWFNPKFSMALGLFTAYSIGDVRTIKSEFAAGDKRFNTAAHKVAEDGLDFSTQYEFMTTSKTSAVVDFRYSGSFSANGNEEPYTYGVMLGIKHFIQGREPNSNMTSE